MLVELDELWVRLSNLGLEDSEVVVQNVEDGQISNCETACNDMTFGARGHQGCQECNVRSAIATLQFLTPSSNLIINYSYHSCTQLVMKKKRRQSQCKRACDLQYPELPELDLIVRASQVEPGKSVSVDLYL